MIELPRSAQNAAVWDVDTTPAGAKGSWGGHWVTARSFNETGPVCITWGAKKQMTWAFVSAYCDAVFAVVDSRDGKGGTINVRKLGAYLKALKSL